MKAGIQLNLIDDKFTSEHGGERGVGKRKTRRLFSSKKPMHVVLRARHSILRKGINLPIVRVVIKGTAKRFGVRVYEQGIETNHLHLVVRSKSRRDFQNFLRVLAGRIAQRITRAVRGNAFGKFWELPPFTRIAEWGKAFRALKAYVLQNELEASGLIPYTPRKRSFPRRKPTLASTY